jgi:hypothetical protein
VRRKLIALGFARRANRGLAVVDFLRISSALLYQSGPSYATQPLQVPDRCRWGAELPKTPLRLVGFESHLRASAFGKPTRSSQGLHDFFGGSISFS